MELGKKITGKPTMFNEYPTITTEEKTFSQKKS